ncbi:tetratricopeptide repeat protein [Myxococcus sp. RHSTA-1-4]|uniref:tetratricopeptide repeat protein n=1 Tax=Myxococcus sp. RHSTA-1-4 TaxID=2874601 RepID=UPI001CBAFE76|nr:tetratricopeptide repeat protein [Myxococcus sp. RHSTA-1-4]MBZ4421341.1 tetratricopeptide repeat protein [Myxococcus sp. RHSTA-1-4]
MTARLLLLLVSLAPVLASAKEPRPRTYDIIIVGGGKTETEAQAALDRLKERVLWVRLTAGRWNYPGVKKSDDYPGLNKGLHIAVLGLCAKGNGTNAKALVKAVKVLAPGTYSKSIKGQYGDPCPPIGAFTPPDAEEKKHLDRIAQEPKSADAYVAYGLALKEQGRLEEARIVVDEALELDPSHAEAKGLAEVLTVLLTD